MPMLGMLGIEPEVELVYRALLARPSVTVPVLGEALDLAEPEVETALRALVGSGLATRSEDGAYVAAPPGVALGALITEQRDGLRLAEQALAALAEEHRAAVAGRTLSDLIEVVTGVEAIRHRFLQVQHAAKDELRIFVTSQFVAVPPGENAAEEAATGRGVRIRVVLERDVLAGPGGTDEAVDSLRHGVELRVVDRLPMKLVLADDDLALVPLEVASDSSSGTSSGAEPGAVMLQRSGLLAALDALFETTWRQAYPLTLSSLDADPGADEHDADGPTALDRQILSLVLAGLTDQAVASQVDVSLRTVQRRLRHLQDLSGTHTRMQLGWYAARHDWA